MNLLDSNAANDWVSLYLSVGTIYIHILETDESASVVNKTRAKLFGNGEFHVHHIFPVFAAGIIKL